MTADTDSAEIVIPALLRAARGAYGKAISAQLATGGFDDVPRNGSYVLGGMVNHGGSAGGLIREMGISKQVASQLIDTLVLRGYLERMPDTEDRRRVAIDVTERGRAAAAAIAAGVQAVDAELAALISAEQLAGMRAGLMALAGIREGFEQAHSHAG